MEIKKKNELSDEELKKVTEGFEEQSYYTFDTGDCFRESRSAIFRVAENYTYVKGDKYIHCHVYTHGRLTTTDDLEGAGYLASLEYLGKEVYE